MVGIFVEKTGVNLVALVKVKVDVEAIAKLGISI